MRSLRASHRGLSEIVGALMLVLIVVVAATALSAFIASEQKAKQAQQNLVDRRALESIRVLSMSLTVNPVPFPIPNTALTAPADSLEYLNATLASTSTEWSNVSVVQFNGMPLKNFTVYYHNGSGAFAAKIYAGNDRQFAIRPETQIQINATLIPGTPVAGNCTVSPSALFYCNDYLLATNFLRIDMLSAYQNDFSRTFVPPTSLATIGQQQVWTPTTGYITEPQLDGSASLQAGNDTIVSWSWTVTNLTHTVNGVAMTGGERASWPYTPNVPNGDKFTIQLIVVNTDGLIGQTQTAYTY